jgi:glyoxylase-like metal-dependent hydrolase (beta-lactamase superfamily II)
MLREMTLGDCKLYLVSDGLFGLDGGAMFGVVPKVLWQKSIAPDERNRIQLGLNCLLILTPKSSLLVDTGIGERLDPKFQDIYAISKSASLLKSLEAIGIGPDDIDAVINTHLHFDHAGGNTQEFSGKLRCTFPNARYIVQKGEWNDALNPNDRTKGSYLEENLLPVEKSGQLELIDGNCEIERGIRTCVTGGHTPYHQVVFVDAGDSTALYLGDLIPTSHHLKIPWVMGYDLYPLDTIEMKRELLDQALKEKWALIFEHDPDVGIGYLEKDGAKFLIKDHW